MTFALLLCGLCLSDEQSPLPPRVPTSQLVCDILGGWDGDQHSTVMYPDLWATFPIRQLNGSRIALRRPLGPMERVRQLSRLQALSLGDSDVEVQFELELDDEDVAR